jgi:hypothetical protein
VPDPCARTKSGCGYGKTPMQTLLDSVPLAQEKLLAAARGTKGSESDTEEPDH